MGLTTSKLNDANYLITTVVMAEPWDDMMGPVITDPINLRVEFEELRVALGLVERLESVPVDLAGRFEIRESLGQGAIGATYLADDRQLDHRVELKVIEPARPPAEQGVHPRLLEEVRRLVHVDQPNLLRVHDVLIALSGERVVAIEYVRGLSLRVWQRGRGHGEILGAYIDVARGLAAAHEADVVHRDVRPDNVIVDEADARVVVVDFGIAGGAIGADRLASTLRSPLDSVGRGTPEYMAPEQWRLGVDFRCDQYSFCVALWEALAGERPFGPRRSRDEQPPPRPPNIPPWLDEAVRRGLAWEPSQRHVDMRALIEELEVGSGPPEVEKHRL